MRILHISTYDIRGGAAIAAYRIHQSLRHAGQDSLMLVREKHSTDDTVVGPSMRERGLVERGLDFFSSWLLKKRLRPSGSFSISTRREKMEDLIRRENADIVNLHWVANNALNLDSLPLIDRPIVWTFHDMWPMTGGCHYSGGCTRFAAQCGACPIIKSTDEEDISRQEWRRRKAALSKATISVVAPSGWMGTTIAKSSLFGAYPRFVIPNPLDMEVFKPMPHSEARAMLNLPQNAHIIFYCPPAADLRKGSSFIKPCLEFMRLHSKNAELVVMIAGNVSCGVGKGIPATVMRLGLILDPKILARYYAASAVTIIPSFEDNLPNVMLESMACGTPCVAFRVGGIPEFVKHMKTGYLAEPFSIGDFATGIKIILENKILRQDLSKNGRILVERECNPHVVAREYERVYDETVKEWRMRRDKSSCCQ